MVQAIENWAELKGTVRAVKPRQGVPRMSDVVLAVEQADDVEGYPNLLTEVPGQELAVSVDTESLGDLEPGVRVRVRAQRADPQTVVAHPEGPTAVED
jgi:hypothetical protein